jgi:adenylylsulfate kinase-like enzyme
LRRFAATTARAGKLLNLTGIRSAYLPPEHADLALTAGGRT